MATGWYVVEPPTSGLLDAIKSQPARALMVGQNTYSGSLSASVKAALANFQGGQFVSGVASMVGKPASASMNGVFFNSAILAATTKKATASMSGVSENRATLAAIITKATAALNGSQIAIGTIAATAKAASGAFGKILSPNFVTFIPAPPVICLIMAETILFKAPAETALEPALNGDGLGWSSAILFTSVLDQ